SLVALNNLAWFLAVEQNAAKEGLEVIDRAIRLAGPVGELLDTRAVIELRMGLPIQAIKDLQEAIADASTPNRLFHFAQPNFLANNKSEAQSALQKATSLGFKVDSLHPLERPAYKSLMAELERP